MRAAKAQTSLRIRALTAHINNESACSGCEFKISKALEIIGTSRNSLYLPHVCRSMYPFVVCYMRRSACALHSLISTFDSRTKHETFCRASSGPKLSAKLVCHSLFGEGVVGLLGPTLGPALLKVSAADKGTG